VPRVLLWDFGDTLVDERWMRHPPVTVPEWSRAWVDVMGRYADDWNVGRVAEHDVFRALAERTQMTIKDVERHAQRCCESIEYNPVAWRVAKERRRVQALVTVNPDLFLTRVVSHHALVEIFDAVVVSCVEGTDDKVHLCEIALDRLRFDGEHRDALLIDNREDHVAAWQLRGGSAYWYHGDTAFESDIERLFE
jgi:FMN phosphatase YigB (HAD superfamily)